MNKLLASAPSWDEQPARVPSGVTGPVITPAARRLVLAAGADLRTIAEAAGHLRVVHVGDVEQLLSTLTTSAGQERTSCLPPTGPAERGTDTDESNATTDAEVVILRSLDTAPPPQTFISAASAQVRLLMESDPESRMALAALAAARALRDRTPRPVHARFHTHTQEGRPWTLVVEDIDRLTTESLAQKLRGDASDPNAQLPNEITLEMIDLTQLGLTQVQMSTQPVLTVVLGRPTPTVVSAQTGSVSTSVAIIDTLQVTVAPTASTSLALMAAVLAAAAIALDPKEDCDIH